MTRLSTAHSTFVIERALPGQTQHAFRFWADPEMKGRWAACHPSWETLEHRFDFRVGGSEVSRLKTPEGVIHGFRSHYLDIVEARRIIYAYEMSVGDSRISTSLATVEFTPVDKGTTMVFTEQVVFLDGLADLESRQAGTEIGLDRMVRELERDMSTS